MGETLDSLARKYAHELAGEIASEMASEMATEMVSEKQVKTRSDDVKILMKNLKCSLEDAMNTLEINGKEHSLFRQSRY